jgi:hypothetical protein
MRIDDQTAPKARREGILVQELSEEILVYDLENHKAHCLNKTAAAVWEHCDGKNSVQDIALALANDLNAKADEAMVWYALDQLGKARLLEKRISQTEAKPRMSRRELVKRAGIAAMIAVPVVTSILAPKALASAGSCGSICSGAQDCLSAPQACQGCNGGHCQGFI